MDHMGGATGGSVLGSHTRVLGSVAVIGVLPMSYSRVLYEG